MVVPGPEIDLELDPPEERGAREEDDPVRPGVGVGELPDPPVGVGLPRADELVARARARRAPPRPACRARCRGRGSRRSRADSTGRPSRRRVSAEARSGSGSKFSQPVGHGRSRITRSPSARAAAASSSVIRPAAIDASSSSSSFHCGTPVASGTQRSSTWSRVEIVRSPRTAGSSRLTYQPRASGPRKNQIECARPRGKIISVPSPVHGRRPGTRGCDHRSVSGTARSSEPSASDSAARSRFRPG